MKVNSKIGLTLSGGGARGSYEAGAIRYLFDHEIYPGIINGVSVGAVNGAAIASGLSIDEIDELWYTITKKKIYKFSLWKNFINLFRPTMASIFETAPLRKFLLKWIDFDKLRESPIKLFIYALNIQSGEIEAFSNKEITVDHIMASSSMPILFPATKIDDKFYWDGGMGKNSPIANFFQHGVKEIYTILLNPIGQDTYNAPTNKKEAIERILDFHSISSFDAVLRSLNPEQKGENHWKIHSHGFASANLYTIQPDKPFDSQSILNFTKKQAVEFIAKGYRDARICLKK